MRQHHVAGEALYVDYAGQTFEIMDPRTGASQQSRAQASGQKVLRQNAVPDHD